MEQYFYPFVCPKKKISIINGLRWLEGDDKIYDTIATLILMWKKNAHVKYATQWFLIEWQLFQVKEQESLFLFDEEKLTESL